MNIPPSIDLIIGPMFAGKTTELLRRLNIYVELGIPTLYVNSSLDSRSQLTFSTHNPLLKSIDNIDSVKVEYLSEVQIDNYKVIGIDEAQFFTDLKKNVSSYVYKGKKIIISGLNGDYQQKSFGDIIDLVPLCDSIDLLAPFCKQCTDNLTPAPFTKRIDSDHNTISIDSTYIPVCRKHLDK